MEIGLCFVLNGLGMNKHRGLTKVRSEYEIQRFPSSCIILHICARRKGDTTELCLKTIVDKAELCRLPPFEIPQLLPFAMLFVYGP